MRPLCDSPSRTEQCGTRALATGRGAMPNEGSKQQAPKGELPLQFSMEELEALLLGSSLIPFVVGEEILPTASPSVGR